MKSYVGSKESTELSVLVGYFILLGLLFYFVHVGQLAWWILLASAIVWFALEVYLNKSRSLPKAMAVGLFLLVFDFIFENTGWVFGLWHTISQFAVGVVPLQVMGIAFFGGTAWAMRMPRKFNAMHSLASCFVFALFGSLGEWLLIRQGLFVYAPAWNSLFAFISYFITWLMLIAVRYALTAE